MKNLILLIACFSIITAKSQIYKGKSAVISIFAETTLENIDAKSSSPIVVMNTATGDIQISVNNQSLVFPKPLMQEHFNENYMESDKYPKTTFKGKVQEKIDYTKDGKYNVNIVGTMDLHGVKKERTIAGELIIKGGEIILNSKYVVKCSDHNITIHSVAAPDLPDDIQVTFNATLEPFKKP